MPSLKQVHGQCRKTQAWYDISPNSTRQDHQRREGLQPGSSVSTPAPSLPPLSGWGDMQAHTTDQHRQWLGICLSQLNEGILHMPLFSEGNISVMVDGVPSTNAWGHLSQLEVHRFLHCGDQVVCPEGLNGELEPMWFTLSEPLVWNTDTLSKPTHEPSLLQVNLSNMKPSDEAPITSVPLYPHHHPPPHILPWNIPARQPPAWPQS